MELIYIFRILYRKKWIILLCTFLAIVAAFVLTMNKKKVYKSLAQLSTGFTVSEDIKLSNENFNIPQIDVKFNNAIENITSPKVLSLLSYRLLLHDLGNPSPYRRPEPSALQKKPDLKNLNTDEVVRLLNQKKDSMLILNPGRRQEKQVLDLQEAYEYNVEEIKKHLYVARYQRTDYIDIAYRSENPELSAFVVNTLCKEFQRYFESFRRERSLESIISLDSLVKKRKAELDAKVAAKTTYLNDSVTSSLDPNIVGASKLSQITQYETNLANEKAQSQDLTYQISQLEQQLKDIDAPKTATNNTSNSNNGEYFALRKQYNDLYDEYVKKGSNDPDMRKRLDVLQQQMKDKAPSTSSTPQNAGDGTVSATQRSILMQKKIDAEGQLRSTNAKIDFYTSKLSELRAGLHIAPAKSAALDQLEKEIDLATLEYTNAKEKYNLATNMNEGTVNNFKQTLYGQPAIEPEPSRRIIILGLSGLSAFILTGLIFVFIEYVDQSIKTPSQFERQTGLPLLGIVNLVNLKGANLKDQVTHIEQEDAHRDNSFRELLRKLRYEIENSNKRIILFTSTEPRQGKTTLSQALAFSLSLGKKKVLLLDTNFCNNDLTVLNNAHPTLEQFTGNGELSDPFEIENLVTRTGVDYVDIIGCKGGDYTPSEILPKNHLLNYLPDLLKNYDYIFMEGAPLNGFTDTKELVQYADGVVAVFAATAEVKQADKDSIKFLHELNGKFLGAILNKVEESDISL